MPRIRPSILFIYGLVITLLAFIFRESSSIFIIAIPNLAIGIILGWRRYKIIIFLFILGYIGLFINSLLVANQGAVVFKFLFLVVREGALKAANSIFFRLGLITGGTLIFLSLSDPLETVRTLENDLRLPKGPTFSIYYALRLLPLVDRIYRDLRFIRRERGYRGYIITPRDFSTFLLPLLSNLLDKAYWTGIAVELRGFNIRRRLHEPIKLSRYDYIVILIMIIQVMIPIAISIGILPRISI